MRLLCRGVPSKMVRLGLSQIDLIIQILLFPLRVPRFLRETPLPLADAADGAERLGQTRHRVKNLEDRTRICLRGWVCNRAAVEDGGVCCAASPHSRLRRQCGVIDAVTARAVNIAGYQFITLIRHLTHNRASGCNINNLTLTTSEAKSATWGKPMNPRGINRGAVAHLAARVIRVLSGRHRFGCL